MRQMDVRQSFKDIHSTLLNTSHLTETRIDFLLFNLLNIDLFVRLVDGHFMKFQICVGATRWWSDEGACLTARRFGVCICRVAFMAAGL